MASGGARNRSGPQPDPMSGRSDRRGLTLKALPSEGYSGRAPKFPLPTRTVMRWEFEDKRRYQVRDAEETQQVAARELALWRWAWRTPQAAAWAVEAWRLPVIALWVRTFVVCESSDATAADKNSLHRLADQIGMTPAGLKENGWSITSDEVAAKRDERSAAPVTRRMRAVPGGV